MLRGHWRGSITKHIVIQSRSWTNSTFDISLISYLLFFSDKRYKSEVYWRQKTFVANIWNGKPGLKSLHIQSKKYHTYPSNSFSDLCFKHLANFAVHNVHFIQRQYQTSWYRKCKDKYKYSNVWNKLILHGTLFTSKYYQKYEYASIMSFIFTNQALRHGLPVSLSLYIKAY